jgi:riboflavin synthase
MFTGIIEEMGKVKNISKGAKSAILTISAKKIFDDLKIGDSVATNGVCLTVAQITKDTFVGDVMNETLKRSSLGSLKIGSSVNLERAMPANGRFGGHIVAGHIDGTGIIAGIHKDDIAIWYKIKADQNILKYIIPKGSVAIDGISLTVVEVKMDSFTVSVIPHTAKETILSQKQIGDTVNLENDLLGKYIEKLMLQKQGITKDFLLNNGF